ncbi:MAG TPA: hypothetical protein VFQ61_14385, partial [Polyangiaceae bacterium]|nr:hypothetical protein [Polyangiaceae bacterium]
IFVAWFAYFSLPAAYAFIWPIHARFPLLAMLLGVAVLPSISRRLRWLVGATLTAVTLLTSWNLARLLREIERTEYAGFGSAIEAIPEGSHVVGLIYGARSAYVRFAPYLHAVAWYQAERGGIVMFTFAEFPSSPFRFREHHRPPPVPERWEWLPQWVDTQRDLDFYDWAVVRGGPAVLPGFALHQRRGDWSVWRHIHEGVSE